MTQVESARVPVVVVPVVPVPVVPVVPVYPVVPLFRCPVLVVPLISTGFRGVNASGTVQPGCAAGVNDARRQISCARAVRLHHDHIDHDFRFRLIQIVNQLFGKFHRVGGAAHHIACCALR